MRTNIKNKYIDQSLASGKTNRILNTNKNRIATNEALKKAGKETINLDPMELETKFTDTKPTSIV